MRRRRGRRPAAHALAPPPWLRHTKSVRRWIRSRSSPVLLSRAGRQCRRPQRRNRRVMRRLMLLRHAKSDWSKPGQRDHDRLLAARGREAAPRIGKYMAAHGLVPELVVCSTATRARETWELVAQMLKSQPKAVHDERIYENRPDVLMDIIHETDAAVHVLMLVGHNPSFHARSEEHTSELQSLRHL